MKRLAAALLLAGLLVVPSAGAATLRTLVINATWGPEPQPTALLEQAFRDTDEFFRRSSFGALGIDADVTPPIRDFVIPQQCFSGGAGPGLGALAGAARQAAAGLGYDVAVYDRFVYVFPDAVCGSGGLGVGPDVLLTGYLAVLWPGIAHELGHTLGLPHASGSACAPRPDDCRRLEYGDRFGVMGGGGRVDFTAREKVQLGWLPDAPRVTVPGRYAVGTPQEPGVLPKALVVATAAGELWVEDMRVPEPTVVIRLVRTAGRPGATPHSIYLASGAAGAAVPGVLRVRRAGGQLALAWLDRARPTRPRLVSVPRPRRGSTTVLVWAGATDAGSGVGGYRVRVDGRIVARTEGTVATLPPLRRGRHVIAVSALDRAGNASLPARRQVVVR